MDIHWAWEGETWNQRARGPGAGPPRLQEQSGSSHIYAARAQGPNMEPT